ncbi:hypothetical protein GLOIN_2v1781965 [Rhizophagus irregularis DAOM 181602=DAOM 197198]|uniref:Uncharacterized protein n=1 Tax=Rhizophagus irregularis (strain DAOM 181602 / DAOM 197198 / MUCL 43194) TaxID=747089 RepID=A0A2P4PIN1_RHIID|nr:hypothetical protein GLOIN_2v1781965 [Rhizophagus irregularis DAOM 181602=DAOM 197198]POG65243.1 hypothetical protein GLOIN_2v1781965 [Rhizophagus irregularis DAOM 181602=DAOM 197198]|eukprot:XP_025172109.1 hypothetical protein GLOIN_2v1781965 [Rhizophagus irregularis DAOM 181602=DAOM 197198]
MLPAQIIQILRGILLNGAIRQLIVMLLSSILTPKCKNPISLLELFNNHNSWSYKQILIEKLNDSNLNDSDACHLMIIGKSDSIVNLLTYHLRKRNLDSVVILGSQFPNDRNDYSYNVLNRRMMCVKTGRLLILTDLEIIYGNFLILYVSSKRVKWCDSNLTIKDSLDLSH